MEPKDRILLYRHYREDVIPAIPFARRSYRDWLRMTSISTSGIDLVPPDYAPSVSVMAYVDSGRWLWKCPYCGTPTPAELGEPSICPWCRQTGWIKVIFPENRLEIEGLLLQMPGNRDRAGLRSWHPDWTMDKLKDRVKRAKEKQSTQQGEILSLSIAPTRDWIPNEILGATGLINYVNTPFRDASGQSGEPIEIEDTFRMPNHTGFALLYTDADGVLTQIDPASSSDIALVSGGPDAAPRYASAIEPIFYVDVPWGANPENTRIEHNAGATPQFVTVALVSTSDSVNGGYDVGDVVQADLVEEGICQVNSLSDTGFQCYREPGEITIREKSTTDDHMATPAQWDIRVYLYT